MRAGLTFSEVMAGKFSLDATDPERGASSATDRLVLRATLTIPGMDAFVRDPAHEGTLEGSVTFPRLGTALPLQGGRFNLFAPSGDPNLKLMVYRGTVVSGGRLYTLHGEKHVRRGSMLRGWPDTTTLRCRLHEGGDAEGPVAGAGILRIGIGGFARQLLSFRTVNGSSTRARTGAMLGFLSFFTRELLDSYT